MYKIGFFGILGLALLSGCAGSGKVVQSNTAGVTVTENNFGDNGSTVAEAHCAKFGKIAVYESRTKGRFAPKYTYLCK